MKKRILTILTILISAITFACSCDIPKPILEYYSSEYVFEGNVISKTYTKDSLHFTVRLKVVKHYKAGANPKYMDFTFPSEGKFTGVITSCDWFIEKDQNWLIFAGFRNNRLTFSPMCSNSQFLKEDISKRKKDVLIKATSFDIHDYIFHPNEKSFNLVKNVKLDSIVETIKKKQFEESKFLQLVMIIDEKGELEKINTYFGPPYDVYRDMEYDSIYGLVKDYNPKKRDSLKEIELYLMESISFVKNWNIMTYEKTDEPVRYFLKLIIIYNEDIGKWEILGR